LLSLSKTKTVSHSWAFNRLLCSAARSHTPFCRSVLSIYSVSSNRLLRFAYWVAPTCGYLACCYSLFGSRLQHDAPSALRGLFFHSRHVAWWYVQRLPPLLLPSSCRFHRPYPLLGFLYVSFHGSVGRSIFTLTVPIQNPLLGLLPLSTGLAPVGVPMVTLTLSVVDGHIDAVDSCFRFLLHCTGWLLRLALALLCSPAVRSMWCCR
jgi:hypothetical protein